MLLARRDFGRDFYRLSRGENLCLGRIEWASYTFESRVVYSGLPGQVANDKGRYRQLRRDRNLPNFLSRNGLQNIRNLGSSARMSRVGTEFDPPKKGPLAIVDVNVPLSFTICVGKQREVWALARNGDSAAI